ncbi:Hsp20/alpha crystallin family protein [Zeaxanthinibacter sp. PT1]|uniref:Hsp20/alpha crystallin family protein n=1 Tax=Zeaxanthinibacter TaxID=561554 RepID=UPI002349218F|nr:Hsp20/alpha crystallin family protein [Zeaxanthinibacter sp. PT1]MDC6352526.1 Hsp20/alpha crystallin family protein [Zeaxanthinibacter sp. PT1]
MSLMQRNSLLFPSLMNEMFKPDWFGGMDTVNNSFPAVNIKENEKDFELELAIPGQKKEDFNIEVDNNVLSISMETKNEEETKEANYTRREFSYRSFKRAFTLPETVDEDKINADYSDGILRFTLPKKEEALPKPKRLIELGK